MVSQGEKKSRNFCSKMSIIVSVWVKATFAHCKIKGEDFSSFSFISENSVSLLQHLSYHYPEKQGLNISFVFWHGWSRWLFNKSQFSLFPFQYIKFPLLITVKEGRLARREGEIRRLCPAAVTAAQY
jgi:hypothetical protein